MTTSQELQLADPDDRPGADVVIWDGKCNFCRSQVVRLQWFDRGSRLAYVSLHDPRVAERFELYIAGVELANGFSELVDPQEQRRRFTNEIKMLQHAGRKAVMPEKFLADLSYVGETAGIALGLDRLFMLLMGGVSIAAAIPFIFEEL